MQGWPSIDLIDDVEANQFVVRIRANYLQPALDAGLIEMTVPDKPQSRLQRYRLIQHDPLA